MNKKYYRYRTFIKKKYLKNYRHAPNIWSDYPAVVIFGRSPTAYRKRQAGYPVRYLSVKKAGYLVIKNRISDYKKKQDIRPNTGMQIRWVYLNHRISTARRERGGGGSSSFELNLTDPCRTWGMLGWRAGSTVSVYAQVQCREPKTGQQKVQFYFEDEIYCRSGYSLSTTPTQAINFLQLENANVHLFITEQLNILW